MKANFAQARAATASPSPDLRLFLFHGPDEAGAADLAARLARALGSDAERVDLEPATLRSDPARLADEAASLSLFGGKRFIRVAGAGEESLAAVEALLAAPRAGNPVAIIAPGLKNSSKLVRMAQDARAAMAVACWLPEGRGAETLAHDIAAEHGLRTTGRTAARLASAAGADRAIMTREVEKLALFLDAAPDRQREITDDALDAIGADLGEAEAGDAVTALIMGRPAELGAELARLEQAGTSPVSWLRQLTGRLRAIADMRAEVDAGTPPAEVAKKHSRHYSQEAPNVAALARWTAPMLARAIVAAVAQERAQKDGLTPESVAITWAIEAARRIEARR